MSILGRGGITCAALLIITGITILTWQELRYSLVSADSISQPLPTPKQQQEKQEITGIPARLAIPALGIDLPVKPGTYDSTTQAWTLDDFSLFINNYSADGSVSNSQQYPTPFIYGHNYPHILGKTRDIKIGDKLTIITENNHRFDYIFIYKKEFTPNEDWLINYEGPESLILMTCEGIWDEKRSAMFFNLVTKDSL